MIEKENGITVIKNPKEPLSGEDVWVIEEDLSIGKATSREEPVFSEVVDVGVDNEENIYVLDSKEAHICVFNKVGGYLRTIGELA